MTQWLSGGICILIFFSGLSSILSSVYKPYLEVYGGNKEKQQKYVESQTACDIIPAVQPLSKTRSDYSSSLEKD